MKTTKLFRRKRRKVILNFSGRKRRKVILNFSQEEREEERKGDAELFNKSNKTLD